MVASTNERWAYLGVELTHTACALLRRLADVGGRCRFQPAADSLPALSAFEEGILAVVLSLEDEQLIRVNRDTSELIWLSGDRIRIASITVELTAAGHAAVQMEAQQRRAANPEDSEAS